MGSRPEAPRVNVIESTLPNVRYLIAGVNGQTTRLLALFECAPISSRWRDSSDPRCLAAALDGEELLRALKGARSSAHNSVRVYGWMDSGVYRNSTGPWPATP